MSDVEDSAARSSVPDNCADAGTPGPAIDPVADLLARSSERRRQQARQPERFSESWFDPDPDAITALRPNRHPVTAYIGRIRQTKSNIGRQRWAVRVLLAILMGKPGGDFTWEQALAYPWHHIGPDDAQDAFQALVARYPNVGSRHSFVQLLRSIIRGCLGAKLISRIRYQEIMEELPTTSKRAPSSRRRRLTAAEITLLMGAAQDQPPADAARDAAMIAVFATTGLRVSELVALNVGNWDQREEILWLMTTKNGQPRAVPVDPRTRDYLLAWLAHRGTAAGALFVSLRDGAAMPVTLPRLGTESVRNRIIHLAAVAEIGHVRTHDFRRTVASILLRTTDAALVSQLLGHSSLAATLVYDMASEDEQRAAVKTLPLPAPLQADSMPDQEEAS